MNDLSEGTQLQTLRPVFVLEDIDRMACAVAESKLFGMKTKAEAFVLMLIAQAEGQHPATITQDYDIIQGKPARKTNSVLARYQSAGGTVKWLTYTPEKVEATFSHKSSGAITVEWTIAMAKQAELTGKDNWKKYSRAMLRARVIAEGVRASYPAAIGGMMLVEEAQDLPPEREINPPFQADKPTQPEAARWSQADFETNLPQWTKLIEKGKRTADEVITMAETRFKFTDAQLTSIRAVRAPIDATATQDASVEQIEDILAKAAAASVSTADIRKKFNLDENTTYPAALVPDILSFIRNPLEE